MASKNLVLVFKVEPDEIKIGYTQNGLLLHAFGRESHWGPISICGHRLQALKVVKRKSFVASERACKHCSRKVAD